MENQLCLNCATQTNGKFCANCGQKTDTHRITFTHFIAHDLLHGTFHLERGILFTIKESLIRPGKAALDYISGKRIRYYNVFYLSLILIGLAIVLYHAGANGASVKGQDADSEHFLTFVSNNIKLIVLGFVPLLAINATILFWKLRLNLAEHTIVAGFAFVGVLTIFNAVLAVQAIADAMTLQGVAVTWILAILTILALLFPFWAYVNLAWKKLSIPGFLWRMIVFYLLLFIELIALMVFVLWLVTGNTDITVG